jgi:hypothetical protein
MCACTKCVKCQKGIRKVLAEVYQTLDAKNPPTKALETLTPKSGDNMQAPPLEALQGKGRFAPPGNTWPSEARELG